MKRSSCWCGAGEQAKAGEGRVVLISASRASASRVSLRLLWNGLRPSRTPDCVFAPPHHQDSALYPVIAQLERASGFRRDDTVAHRLDKLEAVLALGTMIVVRCSAAFADLLSIPTGDRYPLLDLTPQKRKEKTLPQLTHRSRDSRPVNRC